MFVSARMGAHTGPPGLKGGFLEAGCSQLTSGGQVRVSGERGEREFGQRRQPCKGPGRREQADSRRCGSGMGAEP